MGRDPLKCTDLSPSQLSLLHPVQPARIPQVSPPSPTWLQHPGGPSSVTVSPAQAPPGKGSSHHPSNPTRLPTPPPNYRKPCIKAPNCRKIQRGLAPARERVIYDHYGQSKAGSQRPIKLPGKEVGINHFLPLLKKGFQAPPNCRRRAPRVGEMGDGGSNNTTPGHGLFQGT